MNKNQYRILALIFSLMSVVLAGLLVSHVSTIKTLEDKVGAVEATVYSQKETIESLEATIETQRQQIKNYQEATLDLNKLEEAYEAVITRLEGLTNLNRDMNEEELLTTFELEMQQVKAFIAVKSSENLDLFVGIEAEDDKVDEVEAALMRYKSNTASNPKLTLLDAAKLKQAQVIKIRNHVFLVCFTGGEDVETVSQAEAVTKLQTQKAVDVINKTFK